MRYWLMKSEPDEFSIDDLAAAKKQTTSWFGVRNYQARNFMRDQMKVGDLAFFYHSSCPEPGIAGVVESAVIGVPDADFGEAVVAVVVAQPGHALSESGVIAALKSEIASFKVPKHVHFVAELPRNAMGKVQKNVLREKFAPPA